MVLHIHTDLAMQDIIKDKPNKSRKRVLLHGLVTWVFPAVQWSCSNWGWHHYSMEPIKFSYLITIEGKKAIGRKKQRDSAWEANILWHYHKSQKLFWHWQNSPWKISDQFLIGCSDNSDLLYSVTLQAFLVVAPRLYNAFHWKAHIATFFTTIYIFGWKQSF